MKKYRRHIVLVVGFLILVLLNYQNEEPMKFLYAFLVYAGVDTLLVVAVWLLKIANERLGKDSKGPQ